MEPTQTVNLIKVARNWSVLCYDTVMQNSLSGNQCRTMPNSSALWRRCSTSVFGSQPWVSSDTAEGPCCSGTSSTTCNVKDCYWTQCNPFPHYTATFIHARKWHATYAKEVRWSINAMRSSPAAARMWRCANQNCVWSIGNPLLRREPCVRSCAAAVVVSQHTCPLSLPGLASLFTCGFGGQTQS